MKNQVSGDERRLRVDLPWPDEAIPMMFYVTIGQEEIAGIQFNFVAIAREERSSFQALAPLT